MPRLKPHEKREALIKKRAELDAQLRAVEAQQRSTKRKHDTRRKVITGAIALEQIERNPDGPFAVELRILLGKYVEARARELFPFLPVLTVVAADTEPAEGQAVKAA
jgi:hypothetical protein